MTVQPLRTYRVHVSVVVDEERRQRTVISAVWDGINLAVVQTDDIAIQTRLVGIKARELWLPLAEKRARRRRRSFTISGSD